MRLFSPNTTIPTTTTLSYVTLDFDIAYDLEEEPTQSILAYDGLTLRVTDLTTGQTVRSVLVEAFAETLITGTANHFPRHLPRNNNTSYFQDMSVWSGYSNGVQHVSIKFPGAGMLGRTIQLRFEYTEDSTGTCLDLRAGPCGVSIDNVVLKRVTLTDNSCTPAPNSAPEAVDDEYTTPENTPLAVNPAGVLENDSDADPLDVLTAVLSTSPVSGTLMLNADGSFVYTPTLNFNGMVTFTYQADDGTDLSNTAVVTLTVSAVNDIPEAVNDEYITPEDTPLVIPSDGLLGNDTDVEGDVLTAVLVSPPVSGTLALNTDGSFVYTPTLNFNGAVTFTYQADDGSDLSNTALVTLTVSAVNDAPEAVDDEYTTSENTPLVVPPAGVLTNDTDVEGDTLTAVLVSSPASGTLTFDADGSFVYTPTLNFNGAVTFTYQADDDSDLSNTAVVTLTVTTINSPPVAIDDKYTTPEDTPFSVSPDGVLANDTDVEEDVLTTVLVSSPASGTLTFNADGSFVYTPTLNFNGTITFTYQADDGTDLSNTAVVTLTVSAVNDAPEAVDDEYTTSENTPLVVPPAGVLANDTDIEGDVLTAVLVSSPASGTLVLNADGSFVYTPTLNFNGMVTFTYQADDGTDLSNTAVVTLTVTAFNNPPTISDLEDMTIIVGDSITIPFTIGDIDTTLNNLTVTISSTTNAAGNFILSGSTEERTLTLTGLEIGTTIIRITVNDEETMVYKEFTLIVRPRFLFLPIIQR